MPHDDLEVIASLDRELMERAVAGLLKMSPDQIEEHVRGRFDGLAAVSERVRDLREGQGLAEMYGEIDAAADLALALAGLESISSADLYEDKRGEPVSDNAYILIPRVTNTGASASTADDLVELVVGLATSSNCLGFLDRLCSGPFDARKALGMHGSPLAAAAWQRVDHSMLSSDMAIRIANGLFDADPTTSLRRNFWPGASTAHGSTWMIDFLRTQAGADLFWALAAHGCEQGWLGLPEPDTPGRNRSAAQWFKHYPDGPATFELVGSADEAQLLHTQATEKGSSATRDQLVDDAIIALAVVLESLAFAGTALVEVAVLIAVDHAVGQPGGTASLSPVDVNHAIRNYAVSPFFELVRDSGADWIPQYFDRFMPDGDFADEEELLDLALGDLLPWLSQWPKQQKDELRTCLSYDLHHRRDDLTHCLFDHEMPEAISLFWEPLFIDLFGTLPDEPERRDHRVLTAKDGWDRVDALASSLGKPDWPWLRAAHEAAHEATLENVGYAYVGDDVAYVERQRHPPKPVTGDPERAFQTRGMWALDRALQWFDAGNELPWQIPADESLPQFPYKKDRRWIYTVSPICSEPRSKDLSVPAFRAIDDFRNCLIDAGIAIGLDPERSLEENIAESLSREDYDRVGMRPFHAWAVLATALLDAVERDHFMRIEIESPLYDVDDMQNRIDRHLARIEAEN